MYSTINENGISLQKKCKSRESEFPTTEEMQQHKLEVCTPKRHIQVCLITAYQFNTPESWFVDKTRQIIEIYATCGGCVVENVSSNDGYL